MKRLQRELSFHKFPYLHEKGVLSFCLLIRRVVFLKGDKRTNLSFEPPLVVIHPFLQRPRLVIRGELCQPWNKSHPGDKRRESAQSHWNNHSQRRNDKMIPKHKPAVQPDMKMREKESH